MAGHSKWANIKHRKGAQDARRSKIFTKIIKELTVAARMGGGDPNANPRLRAAILNARDQNMPNDNITRAIKKGTGELEGVQFEEVTYEGYGPSGVAVMVKALTDNKNRTTSEIRYVFAKNGGALGESGCVNWMFQRKGVVTLGKGAADENKLMETVLDFEVEDIDSHGEVITITTALDALEPVRAVLEKAGIAVKGAKVEFVPQNNIMLTGEDAKSILRLLEALEDHDDVQEVVSNFDVDDRELDTIMKDG
jgi:YebC/PmpR family DNA-binding regulatory protein